MRTGLDCAIGGNPQGERIARDQALSRLCRDLAIFVGGIDNRAFRIPQIDPGSPRQRQAKREQSKRQQDQ